MVVPTLAGAAALLPATELAACGLGFVAGVAHARLRPDSGGKIGIPFALLLLVLVPFAKPVLSPLRFDRAPRAPRGDGIVLQSTSSRSWAARAWKRPSPIPSTADIRSRPPS
jgi:hypothetical protein